MSDWLPENIDRNKGAFVILGNNKEVLYQGDDPYVIIEKARDAGIDSPLIVGIHDCDNLMPSVWIKNDFGDIDVYG